ncbi:hypothetical protein NLJ89_g327 [Agrocybe chaxingu]|uniref:HNH nuclease domain-containing protein n=1 Tax=Agrocybe chaxingu TaxID=84603 RepID=A0A9W8N257_9AGAR|nr:hypothetical protein NLJ89_g327 [Agrocybe chaxingu]
MSSLAPDAHSSQLRVVIPDIRRLPPNPHIVAGPVISLPQQGAWERALAAPSVSGTTDSEISHIPRHEKALRNRLLAYDQRSFLTGSAAADLEAAHIISAVRHNDLRKLAVETYLTQQRIQPLFRFDNAANAILLESSLHTQWDIYGTFCFIPAENDLVAMLESLKRSNEMWRQDAPDAVSKEPFYSPKWDIIVLHPHAMFPEGMPLAIAQDRTFFNGRNGGIPVSSHLSWTWWIAAGDTLRSATGTSFEPFVARDLRSEFGVPPISSLAMVINAHSKLQRFLQDFASSASTRVLRFAQLISDLVTEIFFVPAAYDDVAPKMYNLLLAQRAQHTQRTVRSNGAQVMQPITHFSGAGLGQVHDSGGIEKSDLAAPPSGDEELGVEAPEFPDEDGLTDSEFQIVSAQASNPKLDAKQRADAAMMMLFGTRRFADPYVHGSPGG